MRIGSIGSGIYSGENGHLICSDLKEERAQLLIADIPIHSNNKDAKCLKNRFNQTIPIDNLIDSSKYKVIYDLDLKSSALFKLEAQQNSVDICNNGFCCRLEYTVESQNLLKEESFWFIAYNKSGEALAQTDYPICEEVCGIFRCEDDSCKSFPIESKTIFKELRISAKFSTNYTYPGAITNQLALIPNNKLFYQNDRQIGSEVKFSLANFNEPILSMSLYGRCYQRDPPYKQ